MISVVIVDDHAILRRGLRDLLTASPDVDVVAAVTNGDEALAAVASHEPDVVLMDLAMPGVDGLEATRAIRTCHPGVAVVVLTHGCDADEVLDAIEAGAAGYLVKDVDPPELLQAIRAAARGEAPLSAEVGRSVVELAAQLCRAEKLTPRGREVLALLAEGLSNKAIACRLGITEKTVKAHLAVVFDRIGVEDRLEAAQWARARRRWLHAS